MLARLSVRVSLLLAVIGAIALPPQPAFAQLVGANVSHGPQGSDARGRQKHEFREFWRQRRQIEAHLSEVTELKP